MTLPDFSTPVSGPAYGRTFRVLATAMLVAVLAMGIRAAMNVPESESGAQGYTVIGLGMLAIAASYWVMVASTTTIDANGIRQSGLTEKKVEWSELHSARLFGPPFARRLMVRTTRGRFRFFFGGSPELLDAFARIAQACRR